MTQPPAALIVETGAGLSDADSYLSPAEADAYHAARGHTGWTGADAVKEAALRQATAVLDGRWRGRFPGRRARQAQALEWPRFAALDRAGFWIAASQVPLAVRHATAELALRALTGPLAPDRPRGGRVQSESVAGISVTYAADAPAATDFQLVELILGAILRPGGSIAIERS